MSLHALLAEFGLRVGELLFLLLPGLSSRGCGSMVVMVAVVAVVTVMRVTMFPLARRTPAWPPSSQEVLGVDGTGHLVGACQTRRMGGAKMGHPLGTRRLDG